MRVDRPNWKFLSPPPATVDALTADFGFRYVATPAGFDHMLTVSVLDAMEILGPDLTRFRLRQALELLGGTSKKEAKEWEKLLASIA